MYSIGIILYELFSRKDPYEGERQKDVLKLVCDPVVNKRPPVPSTCPPKVTKLMKSLLHADPNRRLTAREFDNLLKDLDVEMVDPMQMNSGRFRKSVTAASDGNQDKSDFLYRVFPRHVAEVILNGGKPEAENHENVTIFFSDVVNFTKIASSLSPMKVSDMLDRLYLAFDNLAEKYQLFKVVRTFPRRFV